MNKFSFYITLLVVACATIFLSCSSDEEYASISLSQTKLYFSALDESRTITYTGSNVASIEVSDVPDGWDIVVNRSKRSITVYGPTTTDDFETGETTDTVITIEAISADDNSGYAYLTVGTTSSVIDLSEDQANSFMVSTPNSICTFSALSTGENQGSISPATVNVMWQTSPAPISYAYLTEDNNVLFYVVKDTSDSDGDGIYTDLVDGNAVIAAYDEVGTVLWSWHVWVSDLSAEESAVDVNGVTIMSRNLGALANNNSSDANIFKSYGLYYQWGRKDPFCRPYYFSAASGTDGTMLNQKGSYLSISYEESTSSRGKQSYAVKNPMSFILGVEDSSYDWLYSAHSSELWGEDKTINDPCPKGWRVASSDVYNTLSVPSLTQEESTAAKSDYGWYMSDALGNRELFMGLGRRGYITGKIQNVNINEVCPEPWAGYYWSADAVGDDTHTSSALFFALDAADISGNKSIFSGHYRANGMQIRCQRDL